MADLEKLISELPKLVHSLKLNIGNSPEIMQQIILINGVQEQLRTIQKVITQELRFAKLKNNVVSTIAHPTKVASFLTSSAYLVNQVILHEIELLADKFGYPEISLTDLQSRIDCWIEWGDFIQAIAADILSDSQLVNQINSDIHHPSLPIKIQEIEKFLSINLVSDNLRKLQQHFQQINQYEQDILQIQLRLNYIIDTVEISQSLLTILLGVSAFFGKSGFALEWFHEDQELIVSSDGKFQELTDIINDCELFQEKINILTIKNQALKEQIEKVINNLEQEQKQKQVINNQVKTTPQFLNLKLPVTIKLRYSTLAIGASLLVLGFGGWMIKEQIPHLQRINLITNQETNAVSNFKSALNLGMEASSLVQSPPHRLIVWQQAESKWHEAINLLESIPQGTSVSEQAKNKLIRYRFNYTAINKKVLAEKNALSNLELAHKLAIEAAFFVQNSPNSVLVWQQAKDKWQQAINLLEAIPEDTSISVQAQEMLASYKTNYAAISKIIKN